MEPEAFHFLRPLWFLALLPFALLWWLWQRRRRRAGRWAAVCDERLLPYILMDKPGRGARWPLALFGLGGLLAIAALAGPVWERQPSPVFHNPSALVIALDLSSSMDAADVKPSRLARARFKIEDILRRRKEGQTALLVYAGEAFTVTPLTDDTDTISHQLAVLSTSLMPSQGSNAASALDKAAELLRQSGARKGDVLLITDGIRTGAALDAAEALKAESYRLSVLGVGTESGAPIVLPTGGFLKDSAGNIVVPKLRPKKLLRLAKAGGGIYRQIADDNRDVDALGAQWEGDGLPTEGAKKGREIDQWREEGPWLLLLLLPIAALAFRRGLLCVVLLLLPLPRTGYAWDWEGLWATPEQQAERAFHQGKFGEAAEKFRDPRWKAAARYKAGEYQEAWETLRGDQSSDGFYNRGNALTRMGRLKEASDAYGEALRLDPGNEDARYNKALVEKELERQRLDQQHNDDGSGKSGSDRPQQGKAGDTPERQDQGNRQKDQAGRKGGDEASAEGGGNPQHDGRDPQSEEGAVDRAQEDEATNGRGGDAEAEDPPESEVPRASEYEGAAGESQQANEQWLRRIPDDPGGLLRRKFEYQYKQRNRHPATGSEPW